MRTSIFISLAFLGLGLLGALTNLYLGFGLSKEISADSDQHLTIALCSLFFIVAGGFGSIRFSKIFIEQFEQEVLTPDASSENSKVTPLQKLKSLREERQSAVTLVIATFVILLLSLISGTISQSGRFPFVHGLLGIGLIFCLSSALLKWLKVLRV